MTRRVKYSLFLTIQKSWRSDTPRRLEDVRVTLNGMRV